MQWWELSPPNKITWLQFWTRCHSVGSVFWFSILLQRNEGISFIRKWEVKHECLVSDEFMSQINAVRSLQSWQLAFFDKGKHSKCHLCYLLMITLIKSFDTKKFFSRYSNYLLSPPKKNKQYLIQFGLLGTLVCGLPNSWSVWMCLAK